MRYENVTRNRRTKIDEMPSKYYPGQTWEKPTKEVKCCGEWIECRHFTNTCDHCNADYNQSGDRLAPREQWGEETGETWHDIIDL